MKRKTNVDAIDIYLGKRLRLARHMRGLSQGGLGLLVGITFQQIQKYEKGYNRIYVSRLVHLATFLDIPVGWFFEKMPVQSSSMNSLPKKIATSDDMTDIRRHEAEELLEAYFDIANSDERNILKRMMIRLARQRH